MMKITRFLKFFENTKHKCYLSDDLSECGCAQIYLSQRADPQLSFKIRFVFLSILFVILEVHEIGCIYIYIHKRTFSRSCTYIAQNEVKMRQIDEIAFCRSPRNILDT